MLGKTRGKVVLLQRSPAGVAEATSGCNGMTFLCLGYHRILNGDDSIYTITPNNLRHHCASIEAAGKRGVSVAEALADTTGDVVALSFDDGTIDFGDNALSVLNWYGFTATVFVVTELLGQMATWPGAAGVPLMSTSDLLSIASCGIEIGSHSATHKTLASTVNLTREVMYSRDTITLATGKKPAGFCYPYGIATDKASGLISKYYDYAVTCDAGYNTPLTNTHRLKRIVMRRGYDPKFSCKKIRN